MKFLCMFLSALMLLCFSACGKDAPSKLSQEEIDALNSAYLEACEKGDYVAMNKAKHALGEEFDYSHNGILAEYNYSYTDDDETLQTGIVYLLNLHSAASRTECEQIADRQSIEENDFIVMDYSFFNNPCFQVRNSYKAENDEQIDSILDILIEYDNTRNTPWERTKESMDREWFIHNLSYEAEFETERAMHVDFDNNDEDKYK